MNQVSTVEERIASRIDTDIAGALAVSDRAGGLDFTNAGQALEFAKMLSISGVAIPKHLRGNPGACLAVVIQAIEWRLSPYAVANKSYSVNDRLAYESQLIQAVILQRAPIKGRFKVEFKGTGDNRVCRVWAELKDGEVVEYESPPFGRITPKNSPLWKADPDQQHFYYSGRALCRRHFPDVLLGVYSRDEIEDGIGPDRARDVTPVPKSLTGKLDALAAMPEPESQNAASNDEAKRDNEADAQPAPQSGEALAPAPDTAAEPEASHGAAEAQDGAAGEPEDSPEVAEAKRKAEAWKRGRQAKAEAGGT
jgi:hypothetical protein